MRTRHRGMSLVELLVGVAIGLFVAAAGATALIGHLRENRALLLESRLMQDLRTASDIVTRDLRRAGHWADAGAAIGTPAGAGAANPYAALAPSTAASDAVSLRYSRDGTENHSLDSNEQFGFRLRNGAVELQLGGGNWQALTDAGTLTITAFSVTPSNEAVDLQPWCRLPCPAGSASTCPPRLQVRSLDMLISARAGGDATLVRSLRSRVRVRNDAVVGACAA